MPATATPPPPLSPDAGAEAQAGHVLLDPDVLSRVFRADEATEAVVEWLFDLRLVCKAWEVCIGHAVVDEAWLRPLRDSGKRFCAEMPRLVHDIVSTDVREEHMLARGCFVREARAHRYDADTQVCVMRSIASLVEDEDTDQEFVHDCADLVRAAMQTHAEHQALQGQACITVSDFPVTHETSHYMMRTGVIAQVVRVLHRHRADMDVANLALHALNRMMEGSRATTRTVTVTTPELIATVVDVLQNSAASADIVYSGCMFVQHLADAGRTRLLLLGGVDAMLFHCMAAFPDTRSLQVECMQTLQQLVHRQTPSRIDFYGASRGMHLVVQSLRAIGLHASRPVWCEADRVSTRLLKTLVQRDRAMRLGMVAAGVVACLVEALAGGAVILRTEEARQEALEVLVRLAAERRHRRAVASALVMPAVLAAIAASPQDGATVLLCCRLLGHLSRPAARTQKKHPVAPAGAVAVVVAALANCAGTAYPAGAFPESVEIQEAGVSALQSMLMCRHNACEVSRCGGARVLMAALQWSVMRRSTVHNACVALSCLAGTDAAFIQDTSQEHGGVVLRMNALMDKHVTAWGLQSQALGVFASLVAPYAHMHAAFRESGGAQRVQLVLAHANLSIKSRAVGERVLRVCAP